jgi:hypothetical protein
VVFAGLVYLVIHCQHRPLHLFEFVGPYISRSAVAADLSPPTRKDGNNECLATLSNAHDATNSVCLAADEGSANLYHFCVPG